MDQDANPLETLWDQILSRQPEIIHPAFEALSHAEQKALVTHLKRMVTEPGWHPEQVKSARMALDLIELLYKDI